jgi:hypothetical protein
VVDWIVERLQLSSHIINARSTLPQN